MTLEVIQKTTKEQAVGCHVNKLMFYYGAMAQMREKIRSKSPHDILYKLKKINMSIKLFKHLGIFFFFNK